MHTEQNPPIKSTALSLDVIETVHALDGATLSEVLDQFEKPRSTVHDHLKTLTDSNLFMLELAIDGVCVTIASSRGTLRR